MFRPMRRFKQQLTEAESRALVAGQRRGVLAVLGDEDYPYTVPLDYWYDAEQDALCFHGAKAGHKLDAMRRHDKATFCVMDEGRREGDDWALTFRSVVVFGRLRVVEDPARTEHIARQIALRFYPDAESAEEEVRSGVPRCLTWELRIEHLTGKRVHEA